MFVFLLNNENMIPAEAVTRIEANAPVNPVDLNGVFAIHCHIWDLDPNVHEVSIYRTLDSGKYERLTLGDHVQPGVADGVFLAVRQLGDSSRVYFMTVTDVTKKDEGNYTCKVSKVPSNDMIVEESISMRMLYFPSETSPTCTPSQSPTLLEGIPTKLNCSSEIGNPPVKIGWKLTGSKTYLSSEQVTVGKTVYSFLTFTPTLADNTAVLLCEIKNPSLPENKGLRTCHVGPITVQRNPNYPHDQTVYRPTSLITTVPVLSNMDTPKITVKFNTTTDCPSTCSKFQTPVSYWITATIFLSVVAFIFFAVAITLSIKYCHAVEEPDYIGPYATRHIQQLPSDLRDKVYVEVEHKRDNGRLYMSLQRPVNNNQCPK